MAINPNVDIFYDLVRKMESYDFLKEITTLFNSRSKEDRYFFDSGNFEKNYTDFQTECNKALTKRYCAEGIVIIEDYAHFNDESVNEKALNVIQNIQAIVENDARKDNQVKLTPDEWDKIKTIAVCTRKLLSLPKPEDIPELIQTLNHLSKTISGQGSPFWQKLGTALIAFTAIAAIVAGVVGAIPTGGASLLATKAGAAVLTGTGAASIVKGSQSDLCKSVGLFKQVAEKSIDKNKQENNGAEPLGPKA